jgi:hypothetical protein
MGSQPGAAKKQTPPPREEELMPKLRPNLGSNSIQNQILAKFGPARLQEAMDRLCVKCIFEVQHHAPCRLLPLDTEGKDCQYFNQGDQYPKEVEWNVRS